MIEFLNWTQYVHVLYVSVIVCYCANGLSGVILSFMYPISKDPRLCGLFCTPKMIVIEFGHWTRYVVYISAIVLYCTNGLSGVDLSFMYPVSKDPRL